MTSFAGIRPDDRVLEIGTGRGALTKELAGLGAGLVGYEVDRENFNATTRVIMGTKARVVLGDAFEEEPEFDVLVSSLPYSESARFVEWLARRRFRRAVVLLQEDFVKKVLAPPGARDYRAVSALAQIAFEIRVLEWVGRRSFSPQPKVSSVIASFAPKRRVSRIEAANVVRLFSLRRRQVASALAELDMSDGGRDYGMRRVYSLGPEEVYELCS